MADRKPERVLLVEGQDDKHVVLQHEALAMGFANWLRQLFA